MGEGGRGEVRKARGTELDLHNFAEAFGRGGQYSRVIGLQPIQSEQAVTSELGPRILGRLKLTPSCLTLVDTLRCKVYTRRKELRRRGLCRRRS
jgi:hypothetical protein